MAINPETLYTGKINAADANYPYGSARDVTVSGDGTGTPWVSSLINDIWGFTQKLLTEAGIVPSGTPDTVLASDYHDAMAFTKYVVTKNYLIGQRAIGSDGVLYQALISNGPNSAVVDPVGDSSGTWGISNSAILSQNNIFCIQDTKSSATPGGTFTSGAWQKRDLNTVNCNTISGASLSSSQITLPSGVYSIKGSCPALKTQEHQARFYNVTDATEDIIGTSESNSAADASQTRSFINGQITLTSSKVFELQHRCSVTAATNGFGAATGFTDSVYSEIEIVKIG